MKKNSQNELFSSADIEGLYKTIFNRRDIRGQFKSDPIPDDVLSRILYAAHHAPSVGYMQPWNFLVVKSQEVKRRVHGAFIEANKEAEQMFEGERRSLYSSLKLEGILESPINLCVTCDRDRAGPTVLGRTHIPTMDLYSTVCAVQNLWLAARAEGVGVGWVSIVKENDLKAALSIPEKIVPIAYLCMGYVDHFQKKPELESKGWSSRMKLQDLIFENQWGESIDADLALQIASDQDFPNQ